MLLPLELPLLEKISDVSVGCPPAKPERLTPEEGDATASKKMFTSVSQPLVSSAFSAFGSVLQDGAQRERDDVKKLDNNMECDDSNMEYDDQG
jgi:hypothetical protein